MVDVFKPQPHPRELVNLTALVERVERVEWQDTESLMVQVRLVSVPEGFDVPATLMFDAQQFADMLDAAQEGRPV